MIRVEARDLALPGRLSPTSLTLAGGELVCLVGPNGSGKTSLLHALARIGRPEGAVRIDGVDPATLPPARRMRALGFLPATRDLTWPLVARDLIALGGANEDELAHVRRMFQLENVADRRADHLSTGERSRILNARALAPRPALLLLDEPTANLDPLWQIRLMAMLKTSIAETGQAALVAIHDLDTAARYADRMILMENGRIVADGVPDALLAGPDIPAVFGIERRGGEWRPVRRPAAPRSSP
jgi:iron complex transport system ATP-binding protein